MRRFPSCMPAALGAALLCTALSGSAAATCDPVLITGDLTLGAGDLQFEDLAVTVRGATLTLAGPHRFCRLVLEQGAVLTHAAADTAGIDLEVQQSVFVDATSAIDVSGRGYPSRDGPGRPPVGTTGGAGHGGQGGRASGGNPGGICYGALFMPRTPGSGGGGATGGRGGGVVRLDVTDTLSLAGRLAADGTDPGLISHGGGAGGSLFASAGLLTGNGSVSANGGSTGAAGGGGGGRIVLERAAGDLGGNITAHGGAGGQRGGAGTIVIVSSLTGAGDLRIDNGGLPFGARTELLDVDVVAGNVVVRGGGILDGLDVVSVSGDMLIEADGAVSSDGRGYAHEQGPGAGLSNCGGGHGGAGGRAPSGLGGEAYDARIFPADLGSGGSGTTGGAGGGRIFLTVEGTLTVNGTLSAEGNPPGLAAHGGGGGGTIRLYLGGLAGVGLVSAEGGDAVNSGGGGGGLITVFAAGCYAGAIPQVSAAGGGGTYPGQPGSVYFGHDRRAQVGEADGFAAPAETTTPSADLAAALVGTNLVGCDTDPAGGAVATTFVQISAQVADAKLSLRLRAGADPAAAADRLVLGFADAGGFQEAWSRPLGSDGSDPGLTGAPWSAGADAALDLELGALPLADGNSVDLLAQMAAHGSLDLVVADHTLVDFVFLSHCTAVFDLSGVDDSPVPGRGPAALRLDNHPNPFNPRTTVHFDLARPAVVHLAVHDLRGRLACTLLQEARTTGSHSVVWDGRDEAGRPLAAGIYFARLEAGGEVLLRKLTLLK